MQNKTFAVAFGAILISWCITAAITATALTGATQYADWVVSFSVSYTVAASFGAVASAWGLADIVYGVGV